MIRLLVNWLPQKQFTRPWAFCVLGIIWVVVLWVFLLTICYYLALVDAHRAAPGMPATSPAATAPRASPRNASAGAWRGPCPECRIKTLCMSWGGRVFPSLFVTDQKNWVARSCHCPNGGSSSHRVAHFVPVTEWQFGAAPPATSSDQWRMVSACKKVPCLWPPPLDIQEEHIFFLHLLQISNVSIGQWNNWGKRFFNQIFL